MSLPAYVAPVLASGGPVAIILIILGLGPDAVLGLIAGIVAIVIRDKERGERCVEVLRALRGRDRRPPLP
jgi:hypothetical protein